MYLIRCGSKETKETSMKTTFATLAFTAMLLAGSTAMAADTPTPGAAEKSPAAQGQLMTNVPSNALPISQFYNEDVYDAKDAKIGDIKDIVDKNGQVAAVILSVGGFLGIGEKD